MSPSAKSKSKSQEKASARVQVDKSLKEGELPYIEK